jgi:hypothetical protein
MHRQTQDVLPLAGGAALWAVALRRPRLCVGPYADRRDAAGLLRRLLDRFPTWQGRVAPWDAAQP